MNNDDKKNSKGATDDDEKNQNKDKLVEAIGEFGRWQLFQFILLSYPIKMSAAWTQMGIVFLAAKTTFRCTERINSFVIENSTCYDDCVNYEYETEFENTIISEWDLICDKAWLANFTQTMSMFGMLTGSIVFGFTADRCGRRPALLTACMLQLIASLMQPFCPDYWSFTIARYFLGVATAGIMVVSFVILMEFIGPSKREVMNSFHQIPLPLGIMVMPLFAYYLRSWNRFCLGVAIPNFLFLFYFFLLPESPKWLISVGKLEQASAVMTTIAKWNKLPSRNMLDIAKGINAELTANNTNRNKVKATYWDLVSVPSLRMKNLWSCICWFVVGICFYGGTQYIGQTSSNAFLTMVLAGGLQVPGMLVAAYLCRRFGRRATAIGLFVVCSISNILLALSDEMFYVKLIAGSIAVTCGGAGFSTMYMFTTELFPTVARNMAMGASSTVSRVGSMLAPFIAGLSVQGIWIPPTVFAIAPLLAAVACAFLPETRGQKLKDFIVES